jgi:hypothetical protein
MMMHAVPNVEHYAKSVTWMKWRNKMSYEPPLDDDIALDKDEVCEDCGCLMSEDDCGEPDRMWGDD